MDQTLIGELDQLNMSRQNKDNLIQGFRLFTTDFTVLWLHQHTFFM